MAMEKQPGGSKFFYGWVVLAALFCLYAISNGIGINTMPLFNPEIAETFGKDNAEISSLVGYFWLLLALPLPFVGQLLDRVSARLLVAIGAIGVAGCLLLLGQARSYDTVVIFYVLYPIFLSMCGLLSGMYIINQWFSQYRGLAVGLYLVASSVGGAVFPALAGTWIEQHGWQQAAFYVGIIGAAGVLLPLFLIRNKPADKATWPDGIPGTHVLVEVKDASMARQGLLAALKSSRFYLLVLTTAMLWFVIIGFQTNLGFFLKDLELSPARAGTMFSLFFGCSIAGKVLFGWLGDKYNRKVMMVVSIANLTAGCMLLRWSLIDPSHLTMAVIILGLGFAGTFTMIQLFVAYLYMGPAYGSILGIVAFADTLASAAGAIVIANIRTYTHTFEQPFKLMVLLSLIALIAAVIIRKENELPPEPEDSLDPVER